MFQDVFKSDSSGKRIKGPVFAEVFWNKRVLPFEPWPNAEVCGPRLNRSKKELQEFFHSKTSKQDKLSVVQENSCAKTEVCPNQELNDSKTDFIPFGVFTQMTRRQNFDVMPGMDRTVFLVLFIGHHVKFDACASNV